MESTIGSLAASPPARVTLSVAGNGATAGHWRAVTTPEVVQVQFAIDDSTEADAIITSLLDRHLVACAQRLGPMMSRYWWEGRQESAEEWLVIAKTQASRAAEVREAIVAAHPYDVPEVLVLPVIEGHEAYLAWVAAQT